MEKRAKEAAWTWAWSGKTVEIGLDRLGTGPTLLFLPALSSISTRKEMWPLQMRLASTYETISVDWPGFGDRAKPEVDWRPEAYAAFLDHLVTHIVPQPFATCAAGHAAGYLISRYDGPAVLDCTDLEGPASHHDRQTQGNVRVDRPCR